MILNSKATDPDDLTLVADPQPVPFTAFITGEWADRGTLAFLWEEALSEHNGTPADDPALEYAFSPAVGHKPAGWHVRGLAWP